MFDPPKVVTYCAPSLKAAFGKEENRKRYGYASVATTVNDALEVLGSAYVDACLVGGPLPGSSCPAPPRASNSIESVGVQNVQGGGALRKAHRAFERKGLQLKACYVDFSLVDNLAMRDGTWRRPRSSTSPCWRGRLCVWSREWGSRSATRPAVRR